MKKLLRRDRSPLPENIAIALSRTHDGFACFMRNGRWGTYANCPRMNGGTILPELCPDTDRSDHQCTLEGLVDQYNKALSRNIEIT